MIIENVTTGQSPVALLVNNIKLLLTNFLLLAESFVANLPPTLAKSQVSSVRKNLKLHLVSVLKHPCSLEFQGQISTLLLDLGMPQSEITRSTPAPREPRKRPRHEQFTEGKKVKIGES